MVTLHVFIHRLNMIRYEDSVVLFDRCTCIYCLMYYLLHAVFIACFYCLVFLSLTARPWAERGSCSTLGLFIYLFFNRAAMGRARFSAPGLFYFLFLLGRARFLLCSWFIFFIYLFFFSFVGDQTQTSTRPNREEKRKTIETLMYGKCYG